MFVRGHSAFITALSIDADEGAARDALTRSAKRAEMAEIDGDLLLYVAKDPRYSVKESERAPERHSERKREMAWCLAQWNALILRF